MDFKVSIMRSQTSIRINFGKSTQVVLQKKADSATVFPKKINQLTTAACTRRSLSELRKPWLYQRNAMRFLDTKIAIGALSKPRMFYRGSITTWDTRNVWWKTLLIYPLDLLWNPMLEERSCWTDLTLQRAFAYLSMFQGASAGPSQKQWLRRKHWVGRSDNEFGP